MNQTCSAKRLHLARETLRALTDGGIMPSRPALATHTTCTSRAELPEGALPSAYPDARGSLRTH